MKPAPLLTSLLLPLQCLAMLGLSGCGDLPRPFAGRPGAEALRLATPPPARLVVPAPTAALLPDPEAKTLAQDVAAALVASEVPAFVTPAQPGDWQLRLTASLEAGQVRLRYVLLDSAGHPRGDLAGDAVPAAAWAQGDPAVLRQAASVAAPPIVGLLRSVDAAVKQSDPNSLYNRPARIFLAGVSGAPGDGNLSLTHLMHAKLPDTGDVVVRTRAEADFIVRGTVTISNLPGGRQQQVEIHWLVFDPHGKEAGDVAQGHDIDKGMLDHYWGDVANAVTDEAAGGVHEVITNWSGRKKSEAPKA